MQKKTFRDFLKEDLDKVFFNDDEFSQKMLIDSKAVSVIKDDDKLMEYNSNLSEGLSMCEILLLAPVHQFEKPLFIGKIVTFNRKSYRIEQLSNAEGQYTILLSGTRT